MSEPLFVTFVWHMHQPYYKDPLTGEYCLPWTYLHAIKDYYDMPAIVEETAGVRVVFNLVPSLLDQILEYAAGTAVDPFLIHAGMDPSEMTTDNRNFILDNFFSANRERMIEPNRRYLELYYLAGSGSRSNGGERLRNFGDQEIRDLQVWFFLAWTGEAARRRYPVLMDLIGKGRNFTPADKKLLFETHGEILREIIPLYKRLVGKGKAELSVTPYYHPILPLLCDQKSACVAMPRVNLPESVFRLPEDARSQVARGIERFADVFGFKPSGMWPSEGSVSDEALSIMAECGIRWAATDEGVLAATLSGGLGRRKGDLYHPYTYSRGGKEVALIFRDHQLSDLIGFTYSRWKTERAVDNFVGRLKGIRDSFPGGLVSIILDGENAWEYYPENGYPFLSALYGRIAADPGFRMMTPSDLPEKKPEKRPLTHIHPGSWINANFGVWIGHPEENKGWDYLRQAREAAASRSPEVAALLAGDRSGSISPGGDETVADLVCRSLYAAEGSDWFWWYGDDHFSPHSAYFDQLFRNNLIRVYRLLNLDVPRELFEPIKVVTPAGLVREPTTFISPLINGTVDDYFEWLGAGLYDLSRQSSAMHAAESFLLCFFYGYDADFLYIRVDGASHLDKVLQGGDELRFHLLLEREYILALVPGASEGELLVKDHSVLMGTGNACQYAIGQTCEARIPLGAIQMAEESKFFIYITLTHGSEEIGRWPTQAPLALSYKGPELELENWLV